MADRAPFNWFPLLEPGEQILWQGRPREGAGWRCVMRDAAGIGFVIFLVGVIILAVMLADDTPGARAGILGFGGLTLTGLTAAVYWSGRDLAHTHYAVTDRRVLAVVTRTGTAHIIGHADTAPRRGETRCGTTIRVGEAERYVRASATRWVPSNGDEYERLSLQALDPGDAPFELLTQLSAKVQSTLKRPSRKGPSVPGMTDYVPPTAPPGGRA